MVFSDDEEGRTYTRAEIMEALALDKEKKEKDLSAHLSAMEERFKTLGESSPFGNTSGQPKAPGEAGYVDPSIEGGSKSATSHNQESYTYPNPMNSRMPHINNSGSPPHFDGTHFSFWKTAMESHLRSCSEELWEVVVQGYSPADPTNLTGREFYDRQLNTTARDKIRRDRKSTRLNSSHITRSRMPSSA